MHNTFTIKEALSFAWKKMSENFWFLVLLTFVFFVVSALLDKTGSPHGTTDILSQILSLILGYFAMFTFVRVGLKIYHGHKPSWKDVVEFDLNLFGLYIVGAAIFSISYILGLLLFIIPGILIIIRFGLFAFVLLDHEHSKMTSVAAIKKSIEITRGHFWHLLGFSLVLAAISIVGVMAFVVGLLITAPFCLLATVYVYEKLKVIHHTATQA